MLLYPVPGGMAENQWLLSDYQRSDQILVLLVIFLVLLLLFGRWQGFHTIVSLTLTCLAVFYVFIPAVLAGENIYSWSIATCIYMTLMTLFIVNGVNRKSIAAVLGCLAGVLVAGLLTVLMDYTMTLTGVLDENSVILYNLRGENPLNLRAIIFGAIIILSLIHIFQSRQIRFDGTGYSECYPIGCTKAVLFQRQMCCAYTDNQKAAVH